MHFTWQCISGCLATCQRLSYRHIGNKKGCPRCGVSRRIYKSFTFWLPALEANLGSVTYPHVGHIFPRSFHFYNFDFFLAWEIIRNRRGHSWNLSMDITVYHEIFPWILRYIWKSRNKFLFENFKEPPQETLALAIHEANAWKQANLKERSPVDPLPSWYLPYPLPSWSRNVSLTPPSMLMII